MRSVMVYHQGDVGLALCLDVLPHGARKLKPDDAEKRMVLALGEATGHSHEIFGECDIYEFDGKTLIHVPEGRGVVLCHLKPKGAETTGKKGQRVKAEHDTLHMAPGLYAVEPARSSPGRNVVRYDRD